MVLLDSVVGIVNSLFGFIALPDILVNPLVSHIYADIGFIAVFVVAILLSRILVLKRLAIALAISLALAMLVGGAYFATLSLAVQIFLIVVFKIVFRKKDEFGSGADLGKMGEEDFSKIGSEGLDLPKSEASKEPKMPELNLDMPATEEPKQKLCPYCRNPLRYIAQYQRYYCDYCRQYR